MCGIAGVVDFSTGNAAVGEKQLASLRHRGPDSAGQFTAGAGSIGQARLSIIDIAGGDPPITNEVGDVAAVLNGEIYNFRSLRDQLSSRGHRFSTRCDTEVLVHLLEDGPPLAGAAALEGMFAAAVWDGKRQRLLLLRDRAGKKPLYYWTDGARLVFGSEIKAVLAGPAVPNRLNPAAIPEYLTFGYVPSPNTFFEGIVSLPPGCALSFSAAHGPSVERFWELQPPPSDASRADVSIREIADETRRLLREAVARRLVADVPLGAFLSGGIDSSALVGLMAELQDEPVKTFSIGFNDADGFDERPYARRLASRFRCEHHELLVEPHAVELIESLVWHHDQPFGDSSAIPTYLLSEFTRQHVTVAISGDGGDELFAGYERFLAARLLRGYQTLPRSLTEGIAGLLRASPE